MPGRAPKDWSEDPGAKAYLGRARRELLPMMQASEIIMTLWSGSLDPKLAMETGYAVLLDKPIIGAITAGAKVPAKLILVCDELIEVDMTTEEGRESSQRRMMEAMARLGLDRKREEPT